MASRANWTQAANFKAELTMQKLIDKFGADKALRELAPVNVNPLRQQQPVIVGDAAGAQSLGTVPLLAGLDEPDAPWASLAGAARPLCRRRSGAAVPGDRGSHPHQGQGRAGRLLNWFAPAQVEAHAQQRQLLLPR